MDIRFDNVNINSAPYRVREISHEDVGEREMNLFSLARRRGSLLATSEIKSKIVSVSGTVFGAGRDALESNIDSLKALLFKQAKNLDIDYSAGTRRYVATLRKFSVVRDFYHLNYAPFTADFYVPSGVGKDTTVTSVTDEDITDLEYETAVQIYGAIEPYVSITISIDSLTAVTKIEVLGGGNKITIEDTFSAGDVIVINSESLKVTINGTEYEYSGIFPRFEVGSNPVYVTTTGTAVQYDISFDYYKNYL